RPAPRCHRTRRSARACGRRASTQAPRARARSRDDAPRERSARPARRARARATRMWYAAGVDWSVRQQEGFALAAAARADRGARAALPGLSEAIAARAAAVAEQLASEDAPARRAWVRRMLAARLPVPARDQTAHPPRALALLAAAVDRSLGRVWLA